MEEIKEMSEEATKNIKNKLESPSCVLEEAKEGEEQEQSKSLTKFADYENHEITLRIRQSDKEL